MLFKKTLLILSLIFVPVCACGEDVDLESTSRMSRNLAYRGESDDPLINRLCRLDLICPTSDGRRSDDGYATIVWLHGGGLAGGKRGIPKGLIQNDIAIATVDYRLTPKVNSKVCIEDAAAAVAWVFDHIEEFGGSKDRIFLSGHSAGGYLTSMVGLDPQYLAAYDLKPSSLAGMIPLSGHTITHFAVRKERGIDAMQPVVDQMAPLYHVLTKPLPPILLITGDREKEMLGRYEENAYLARMLKVAGQTEVELRELTGFNHGGMVHPATQLVLDFVHRVDAKKRLPAAAPERTD